MSIFFLCDLPGGWVRGRLSGVSSGISDCRGWFVLAALLLSHITGSTIKKEKWFPPTCLFLGTMLPTPHLT